MKSLTALFVLIIIAFSADSQIYYLRYNDNFSYLKSDSIRRTVPEKIKYIPLSAKVNVSLGGEIREQLQYYRNINFGDVPATYNKSSGWQLWHRLMLHANIEVGKKTRLFTQLGSTYRFLNPNPLTPEIEQNELSLHQTFIDYRFGKHWWQLHNYSFKKLIELFKALFELQIKVASGYIVLQVLLYSDDQ